MPNLQYINTGSGANTGDGDSLRSAFIKVNNNFVKINSTITNNLLTLPTMGAVAPTGVNIGSIWYNTDVGKLFMWDGGTWVDTAFYMPNYELPPLTFDQTGQVLTIGNYGYPIWKDPVAGSGTRWDAVPAEEGCPIYAELTPDHFYAYTQRSHLVLENDGYWDVGSVRFGNGIQGYFDGNINVYSTGTITLRSGYSSNEWQFGDNGILTLPNGSTIGSNDAIFGIPITTARGSIFLGNQAECGNVNHFHIMKSGQQDVDLFLGDDNNYVKLPSTGGVEISSSEIGAQHYWNFGTDTTLTIPGDIQDTNGSVIRVATTSTAPTRVNGQLWFNTVDGRAYIRYDNNWIDLSPPEIPSPSTYLDGLTISDTTISAVDTTGTVSIESGVNIWEFGTDGTLTLPAGYALPNTVGTAGQVLSVSTNSNVLYWTTASGFKYARVQEGITSHPVTSITGNSGDGLSLTSDRWAQLMWVPDTGAVTLNDIDQGAPVYHWVYVDALGFNVENKNLDTTSTWTFGTDGILQMPPGNEDTQGWIQWSHADDDLTNTAGIGFVDNYNIYTGLGLVAPTDTNAAKGIWFGTPADPTNPFRPETSMVFKGDSLYLPKNGYIKSHDINYNGYPTLGNTGTSITIQTAATTSTQHNWVFGTDGILTLPSGLTFSTGAQIFEQADHIGPSWASGLNIRGSSTNDPIRIYAYGGDSKGYNAAGVTVNQHSVVIYGDSREPSSTGTAWNFGSDGELALPTNGYTEAVIKELDATALVLFAQKASANIKLLAGATSAASAKQWLFSGTDGTLTLPSGGGSGGGDEGAEIDFTKAPNSTLSGPTVILDQYVNKFRFFESTGTNRGAYIDLSQAAAGVGTLLNNRVSGFVNAGTFVTMDNIKVTVTTSSNRGLSLATVSGTATCYISGTYGMFGGTGTDGASAGVELTTTPSVSIFSWNFSSEGDSATYILNYGYTKAYRITMMIGAAYNNNMITIERLV